MKVEQEYTYASNEETWPKYIYSENAATVFVRYFFNFRQF